MNGFYGWKSLQAYTIARTIDNDWGLYKAMLKTENLSLFLQKQGADINALPELLQHFKAKRHEEN